MSRVAAASPAQLARRRARGLLVFATMKRSETSLTRVLDREALRQPRAAERPRGGARVIAAWPRRRLGYEFSKRALDVAGSALLLVLSAPVLVLACVALRLESREPVFASELRCGRRGRRFRMRKLRTALPAERAPGRVSRLVRSSGLDEIPQLWNVLRGEMSLVGPRPARAEEVLRYSPRERCRLSVPVGMMGLGQLAGGVHADANREMRADLEYVGSASLALDLQLFVRSLAAASPFKAGRR